MEIIDKHVQQNNLIEKREFIHQLIDKKRFDDALELTIITYEEALANNQYDMISFCLYFFGLIEERRSDIQKAMTFYKKATILARKYKINDCLVKVLNQRGVIYWLNGKFHDAIAKYLEALAVIDVDMTIQFGKERILNNMGLIYVELGEFERAIQYYFECVDTCKTNGNEIVLTTAYSNLTDVFIKRNALLKAKYYNRLSKQLSTRIKDDIGVAIALSFEAVILHKESGDWLEVKDIFESSIKIAEETKADIDRADITIRYAQEAFEAQEYKLAEKLLNELVEISYKKLYHNFELNSLRILEKLYDTIGSYEDAYRVTKRQLELNENAYAYVKKKSIESIDKNITDISEISKVDELQKTVRTLKLLSEIGQKITACFDVESIYAVLINDAKNIFECDAFGVGIKNVDGITIDYKYYDDNQYTEIEISLFDEGYLMSQCINAGEDIIIYNTQADDESSLQRSERMRNILKDTNSRTVIFCPIKFENTAIGGITIQATEQGKLTYVDLETLRVLATYIAIAFTNLNRAQELVVAKEKMEEASMLDGLTGVFNRHALGQYIGKEFIGSLESKLPATALMIDIDYFKQYNDNYGHVMGDKCLKRVCGALRNCLSSYNHKLFRYGGDEFFVIIESLSEEQTMDVLNKIMKELEFLNIEHKHSKIANHITLTIGVTIIKKVITDYTAIFISADEALYKAKDSGRNRYEVCYLE